MESEGRINYPGRDTSNGRSPGYTWAGTVLSFFAAVTLLSGCAGTSERQDHLSARTIELSRDVSDLKMQVKDIQSGQMDNAREMGGSAESIRKRQAELGARLDEVESRLAKTSGKVEVLEHGSKGGGGGGEDASFLGNKVKKLEDDKQDLDRRVTELERALNADTGSSAPTHERAMAPPQAPVAAPAMSAPRVPPTTVKKPDVQSSLPLPKQAPPQKTAAVAKQQAPKPAAPVVLESKDEEAPADSEQAPTKKEAKTPSAPASVPATDEFGQGMQLYEKKDYKSAMAAFRAYLAKNPNDKKAPAAHFYIGESYYNQNKYEESILEYQKVIKDHPKSGKTPDALYKQAMSFYSLGDKMSCKLILEKLIKNFPKSNLVTSAKNQLKKIK
ncbi:MAG: tol-pal system protein YbgF [Deltaproteobacteria bacterium]|nr:tol-pal system protein YbgF [Deltaproteobacteria bacterium]